MPITRSETAQIRTGNDVVRVRQLVRARAVEIGMGLVDQTKIVTAASEIARNTLDYRGGGTVLVELEQVGARRAVRLTFEDQGPGIVDVERAMGDHFTTGGGLGLGLGGAKRLSNEFEISSTPGLGTRVMLARWK